MQVERLIEFCLKLYDKKVKIMYIFERFIGVTTYSIALILICILISKSKGKSIGKVLKFYSLILFVMAYFYVPSTTADLYRLTEIMNYWASLDFSNFREIANKSTTPIAHYYIYGIGKLGNDRLLPAITAYIYYSNIFYILRNHVNKNKISPNTSALVLFFIMSSGEFIGLISGIRNHLAFSIIAFCVYREMVEKKSIIKSIPFYIISALMHNAAFALVVVRMGYLLVEKSDKSYKKVLFVLFDIMVAAMIIKYGAPYWISMVEKAIGFMSGNPYTDIWGYLISTIQLLTLLIIYINLKKSSYKSSVDSNKLTRFSMLIGIISIISSFEYNIYSRFISIMVVVSIPWILEFYEHLRGNHLNRRYINAKLMLIIASILTLVIASIQGNLSALKFFTFN